MAHPEPRYLADPEKPQPIKSAIGETIDDIAEQTNSLALNAAISPALGPLSPIGSRDSAGSRSTIRASCCS
jgi:hypothetical protein